MIVHVQLTISTIRCLFPFSCYVDVACMLAKTVFSYFQYSSFPFTNESTTAIYAVHIPCSTDRQTQDCTQTKDIST